MLAKTFLADDARAHAECTVKLRELLERIGRTRLHRGRYTLGDALTLEDVALAALAAPLVLPPLYAEGRFPELVALQAADAELRAAVGEWRATDVGKFVLRLYAEHRLSPLSPDERRGASLEVH
jgi:glutathione S-transferase